MTEENKQIFKVWEIHKDSVNNFWPSDSYYVYLSEDKQWWSASTFLRDPSLIGKIIFMSPITEESQSQKWETVRKYLIHYLLPTLEIPETEEYKELDRFNNLET